MILRNEIRNVIIFIGDSSIKEEYKKVKKKQNMTVEPNAINK